MFSYSIVIFSNNSRTQRYKSFNARVEKKNGTTLIESIVESIGRMLNRKMDAVKCIVNKSEEYAEEFHRNNMLQKNFTYYSSKFSLVRKLIVPSGYGRRLTLIANFRQMTETSRIKNTPTTL